jgi:hypothetical protein
MRRALQTNEKSFICLPTEEACDWFAFVNMTKNYQPFRLSFSKE